MQHFKAIGMYRSFNCASSIITRIENILLQYAQVCLMTNITLYVLFMDIEYINYN